MNNFVVAFSAVQDEDATSFDCRCPPGFVGDRCESVSDLTCADRPCRNGATCADRPDGYRCHCSRGYGGEHCDDIVDACLSEPCANGESPGFRLLASGRANGDIWRELQCFYVVNCM